MFWIEFLRHILDGAFRWQHQPRKRRHRLWLRQLSWGDRLLYLRKDRRRRGRKSAQIKGGVVCSDHLAQIWDFRVRDYPAKEDGWRRPQNSDGRGARRLRNFLETNAGLCIAFGREIEWVASYLWALKKERARKITGSWRRKQWTWEWQRCRFDRRVRSS